MLDSRFLLKPLPSLKEFAIMDEESKNQLRPAFEPKLIPGKDPAVSSSYEAPTHVVIPPKGDKIYQYMDKAVKGRETAR